VALFTAVADSVYVPASDNAGPASDPAVGVPTSYYATVQARVAVEVVEIPTRRPTC
jgi:transcriptional regulator